MITSLESAEGDRIRALDMVIRRPGIPVPLFLLLPVSRLMGRDKAWMIYEDVPIPKWPTMQISGVLMPLYPVEDGVTTPLLKFVSSRDEADAAGMARAIREMAEYQGVKATIYFCPFAGGRRKCPCGAVQVTRHKRMMVYCGDFRWLRGYPEHDDATQAIVNSWAWKLPELRYFSAGQPDAWRTKDGKPASRHQVECM